MTEANQSGVTVDRVEIDRKLQRNADELYLLFRLTEADRRRPLAEAISAAEIAMEHANNSVTPDTVAAQSVEPSPYGPVVVLDWIGDEQQNSVWLTTFAGDLASTGWAGTISPAPPPPWLDSAFRLADSAKPAAFLAFRMSDKPPTGTVGGWSPPRWAVEDDTTGTLCRHLVDWVTVPGVTIQLTMGRSRLEYSEPDVTEMLLWAAEHDHTAGVAIIQDEPPVERRANLGPWGQLTCQVGDNRPDWRSRVDDLRATLLWLPEQVDLAFVRTGRRPVTSWIALAGAVPALPHVTEAKVRRYRHLWNRYLPDAHGIQVLTDEHLSRLGPLTDWDVQSLAGGRHLVQARDLEPWFAATQPDPDVVAAARTDFADILLTPEVIAAHG